MFCAGRVVEEDLKRTMKACGGAIQTTVNNMTDEVLGMCELFEEEQIGGERYAEFEGVEFDGNREVMCLSLSGI